MKGGKKRTSGPRRTANEEELASARVDPDHAAPAYDGHAVLQGEALVSEDEEEASLRKLRKRDQPSLVRLVTSLNVGALICAFAYVAFQAPNNFAIGGATGFSIVLATLVPALSSDVALWIVNAALVIVGLIFVERKAVFWSVVASVVIPVYVSIIQAIMPITGSLTGDMWMDLCCTVLSSRWATPSPTTRARRLEGRRSWSWRSRDTRAFPSRMPWRLPMPWWLLRASLSTGPAWASIASLA